MTHLDVNPLVDALHELVRHLALPGLVAVPGFEALEASAVGPKQREAELNRSQLLNPRSHLQQNWPTPQSESPALCSGLHSSSQPPAASGAMSEMVGGQMGSVEVRASWQFSRMEVTRLAKDMSSMSDMDPVRKSTSTVLLSMRASKAVK